MAADPKLSELENSEREQALAYVRSRWSQYSSATRESRKDVATFVATINAGGAVTVLAFAGAALQNHKELAEARPLRLAILCFVLGVILTAVAHAIENDRLKRLFEKWREDVDSLYIDKLSFNQIRLEDARRAGQREFAFGRLIWAALVCFVIGAALGVLLLFGGR